MATITIKKKKPMSLQGGGGGEAEETVATMGEPANKAGPSISGGKGPSYAIEATCAILTVVCFVALLLLQWVELQDYNKPPAAFLTPGVPLAS